MMQTSFRILQNLVSLIEFREVAFVIGIGRIGMALQRFSVVCLLERGGIEPRRAWLLEQREVIRHAAKLSPQEQCATAFGFVTLNPPFCRSSLKSRTDPLTNSALLGSTTIRTLYD